VGPEVLLVHLLRDLRRATGMLPIPPGLFLSREGDSGLGVTSALTPHVGGGNGNTGEFDKPQPDIPLTHRGSQSNADKVPVNACPLLWGIVPSKESCDVKWLPDHHIL
jgi:hypothetical protein